MHHAQVDAIEIDNLVLFVIHFCCAMQKFCACGSQVGTAACSGIVPAAGCRRSRMKVFRLGEILADERGSYDFAIRADETAIGLIWKDELRYAGHDRGIQQASQYSKNKC